MTTLATRIAVQLLAADPILRNGLRTTLQSRPQVRVVDEDDSSPDTVVIVATDRIDETTKQTLRSLQCRRMAKVVLIAGDLDDADVMAAVENGVCAVARRAEVDADILVRLATAAMSQMSRSEKPARRSASRSSSSTFQESVVSFTAKSSIARCRLDSRAAR